MSISNKEANWEFFLSQTFSDMKRFEYNVSNLLASNMPPHSGTALARIHPLFTGNRVAGVMAALAASYAVDMLHVIAYYKELTKEQRAAADGVVEKCIAEACSRYPEDILIADPALTERLKGYEMQVITAIGGFVSPPADGDFVVKRLSTALRVPIPKVLAAVKRMPVWVRRELASRYSSELELTQWLASVLPAAEASTDNK